MIDAFLVALLLFLAVRGWFRGLVREALDLAGLLVGTVLAFRLGPLLGGVISSVANTSPDTGRVVGGLVILVATGVAAAFLARAIEPRVRRPGINLIDRVGGATLAAGWGAFLLMVLLSLLLVLPLPAAVGRQLDGSAVTRVLTAPGGVPQQVFHTLAGDRVIQALLRLREAVGEREVIVTDDDSVDLPAADPADLSDDPAAAAEVFDLLNRARVDGGLAPLAWSPALSEVAAGHAREMYLEGRFAHHSSTTGTVGDRLEAAGITYSRAGENLALAATITRVHNGLMDSPGHRENILRPEFRRVGVAVVAGPLGLMTVEVFTG
ncbi:MAG: CvpA family protein [Acidimicrobiia bacterium]|nr:CvpA family protein [Acidimicrobiia bacterium]